MILRRPCTDLVTVNNVLHATSEQEIRLSSDGYITVRWHLYGRKESDWTSAWTPTQTTRVSRNRVGFWTRQFLKRGFRVVKP